MTREQKEQIRNALLRYVAGFATQAAAAESLQSVSPSIISSIKNNKCNKWERVTGHMWQNIARQVGFYCSINQSTNHQSQQNWKQADTGAYLLLRILFGDAQRYAMAYGVTIQTGLGKTFCAKHYANNQEYAYYISCNENMNRKDFLQSLLIAFGKKLSGNAEQTMQQIIETLEACEEPLLIIDDAQKLKDRVLHFVITLYKRLINHCGIVILGNDELRTRIVEGARLQKKIFEEVYNTIGRRFVTLGQPGPRDIELICRANGIDNETAIEEIKINCKNNLHLVTDAIQKLS